MVEDLLTVGSFLFSAAMISWVLEKSGEENSKMKWLERIGDCSYGIFYVHMAVLSLVAKLVQSDNWYLFWNLRFVLTSILSFAIVMAGQKILRNKKKILRFIGFV